MNRCQHYFQIIIPIILLMTGQSVFAAPVELSVEDCTTLALQNNYTIKYAKSAREKSYWAMSEAKKNKGLSVSFTHTDQRYSTPPDQTGTDAYRYTNDFDNQIALTLPVYTGGKLENQIAQAKLNLKVSELDVEVAKQQLKLTVLSDYLTVLEYRNEVQVNQETVKNYEEHLKLVNAKFELGLVAKTDVLSSQVDLAGAQNNLITAQNNYANAVADLNNDIGLPHTTEVVLKDNFTYEKYQHTLEECLAYGLANRPELTQYEAQVANAQYDVDIAKSAQRPTVSLTAAQDWYDSHLLGTKNGNWSVKLTTSLNVFDSGITASQVKQAQHNVDMVKDQAAQQRDTILLNVRQYYLSMQEAEKQMETTKVSVNQAEENLMIQKASYEVGIGTNLDLRDAVVALDTAKKNYIQALYSYNTNKANLEQAMGMPVK
ncbi:MAG: tolC 2 [Firmicutes bacterium]|nr:tolC 2 [Bacillota bacterium]